MLSRDSEKWEESHEVAQNRVVELEYYLVITREGSLLETLTDLEKSLAWDHLKSVARNDDLLSWSLRKNPSSESIIQGVEVEMILPVLVTERLRRKREAGRTWADKRKEVVSPLVIEWSEPRDEELAFFGEIHMQKNQRGILHSLFLV
ncbi:hypothetical protein Leryth_024996 [Lithospermum erythrorhizon]|nr:hypothetical protein Leryth_024996 [Lithospermum erythrorhizon]